MGEVRKNYMYLPLEDAIKAVGQKVNLFAVVTEIGVPKRSRGTDYVLILKIADQSLQALGLSVNFFAEQLENLPHAKSSGDIICLHRVMIEMHKKEVYAAFNKKFSSFALFERKDDASYDPYQNSAKFHGSPHDEDFVRTLRTWQISHHTKPGADDYTLKLNEIKDDKVFDLVCKVLHVCENPYGGWVMFVWDGTDTPSVGLQTDLEVEEMNPCLLHLEPFSISRDIQRAFPCVGTILRVFAREFFDEIPQLQNGGQWIRLRNIIYLVDSGIWKGTFTSYSKIRLLSGQDDAVSTRQRSYLERISSVKELASLNLPLSYLTVTDYERVTAVTLMESLSHPEVTHKFKCVVRVIAAYPWKGKDILSGDQSHYRFRLTLEDPTARIHSYICGEDGVKFFGGYPSHSERTIMMKKLLGICETSTDDETGEAMCALRNPPWVSMCLKSYYCDKTDPWETRRYRVFGTKLVV